MPIAWASTGVRPGSGPNANGSGWRIHAIVLDDAGKTQDPNKPALCGTTPRYGWQIDLHITDRCRKCVRAVGII